jgi:hypothetical protein
LDSNRFLIAHVVEACVCSRRKANRLVGWFLYANTLPISF